MDPLFQLAHMGDDAHQASALCQVAQSPHRLAEGLLIQRAEALIHKHGVQPDAAGRGLHLVRQPQGKGQGRFAGLTAGEGLDASAAAVVVVDDVQLQAALAAVVLRLPAALQFILAAGHGHEPPVGPGDDPLEAGHLHIGLQHHLLPAGDGAGGRVGQGLHPPPLLLQPGKLTGALADALGAAAVGLHPGGQGVVPPALDRSPLRQGFLLLCQRLPVDLRFAGKPLRQLAHSAPQLRRGFLSLCQAALRRLQRQPQLSAACLQLTQPALRLSPVGKGQLHGRKAALQIGLFLFPLRRCPAQRLHAAGELLALRLPGRDAAVQLRLAPQLLFLRGHGPVQLRPAYPQQLRLSLGAVGDLLLRHIAQQLPGMVRPGGTGAVPPALPLAGRAAGRRCRLPGVLRILADKIQPLLIRCAIRQGRRGGMLQRSAHRTGLAGTQLRRQQACLLIQKQAVHPLIGLLQPLCPLRRQGVALLGLGQAPPQGGTVRRLLLQSRQGGQPLGGTVPLRQQTLPLRAGIFQRQALFFFPFQRRPAVGQCSLLPLQTAALLCYGLLCPCQFPAQILPQGIPGQILPQQGALPVQLLPEGLLLPLPPEILFPYGQFPAALFQRRFRLRQLPLRRLLGADLLQGGSDLRQTTVNPSLSGFQLPLPQSILFQKPVCQNQHLRHRKSPFPGLFHLRLQGVHLFTAQPLHVLAQAGGCGGKLPPKADGPVPQLLLQPLVQLRAENASEDLLSLLRGGQQQLQKVPLGNHGDLGELFAVHPQDLPHGGGDLPGLADDAAIGANQLRPRLLRHHAAALFGRAQIVGVAADGVGAAAVGKHQLHLRGSLRRGVFAAQHPRLPVVAAGLAVEGEGDGVKDGGLSGAGIAGDEVQSPVPQPLQLQHRSAGVGAEGGHGQFQRSHASPSQILAMSFSTSCCWRSVMGWPFCRAYSWANSSRGGFSSAASSAAPPLRVRALS